MKFIWVFIAFVASANCANYVKLGSQARVCAYVGNSIDNFNSVKSCFEQYGITLQQVAKLNKESKDLHLIFDAFHIPFHYFPQNYIVFQTLDLDEVPLTKNYFEKLKNAIAVWDPSWKNIGKYSLLLENYYFYSEKLTDPLLLPCFLNQEAIDAYKEVLFYSNAKDTDISSHLPAIFTHTVMQNPKIVVESGVRSGESSYAFKKAIELCSAILIGIDIDDRSKDVYEKLSIANAEFKVMDDLRFSSWWATSQYHNRKADIIFIDTSHHYEHTVQELQSFFPLLNSNGFFMFHDTNMCPLKKSSYQRINNTFGSGWDNQKGVIRAIKEFFSIDFDETLYINTEFQSLGYAWMLIHYPYCNGLTIIKRIN